VFLEDWLGSFLACKGATPFVTCSTRGLIVLHGFGILVSGGCLVVIIHSVKGLVVATI
jgi:hypothetical protein